MGRHSEERDTAGNGPQDALSATESGSGSSGGYWGAPDGTDALRLPESMFDPEDTGMWDFRPVLNVELPEDET